MKKILIIEDDPFLRKICEQRLSSQNQWTLSVAHDGEEGLMKILNEIPDLVLLDLVLPKKNGFQLLEELKRQPQLSGIPVIVISSLEQDSDMQKGLELGADLYLKKSDLTLDLVLETVEKKLLETV